MSSTNRLSISTADAGKCRKMQSRQRFRQPFIIFRQSPKPRPPIQTTAPPPTVLAAAQILSLLPITSRLPTRFHRLSLPLLPSRPYIPDRHTPTQLIHPLPGFTASASPSTSNRSCSNAAVTTSASRLPNVSTAMCVLFPFRRLAPSYPARPPDSKCRLQGSRIENGGRWLGRTVSAETRQGSQIMNHHFKNTPALIERSGLLKNGVPGRQIIGHHTPGRAGPDHPPETIKNFA